MDTNQRAEILVCLWEASEKVEEAREALKFAAWKAYDAGHMDIHNALATMRDNLGDTRNSINSYPIPAPKV